MQCLAVLFYHVICVACYHRGKRGCHLHLGIPLIIQLTVAAGVTSLGVSLLGYAAGQKNNTCSSILIALVLMLA